MKKIGIVFGSTTDNTRNAAQKIAGKLSGEEVSIIDVSGLKAGDLDSYPNLILGTSTWGFGDLQDDWEEHLSVLTNSNLEGKTVAFFGLGDSSSYPDTFVDGVGILYEAVKDKGCNIIGEVPVDGYHFDDSKAAEDGHFAGLALDEDNEASLTDERIDKWITEILPLFT